MSAIDVTCLVKAWAGAGNTPTCHDLPPYLQYVFYEKSRTSPLMVDAGNWLVALGIVLMFLLEVEAFVAYLNNKDKSYAPIVPPADELAPYPAMSNANGNGGMGKNPNTRNNAALGYSVLGTRSSSYFV